MPTTKSSLLHSATTQAPIRRVVVVAPTPSVAGIVVAALSGAGHEVVLMADFTSAKSAVDERPPDLIVAEVRLGAFNGFHLVIRARARGARAPAILIGPADAILEADAMDRKICYMVPPLSQAALEATVGAMLRE
jgi:DNA-binding response OmpR family regulator